MRAINIILAVGLSLVSASAVAQVTAVREKPRTEIKPFEGMKSVRPTEEANALKERLNMGMQTETNSCVAGPSNPCEAELSPEAKAVLNETRDCVSKSSKSDADTNGYCLLEAKVDNNIMEKPETQEEWNVALSAQTKAARQLQKKCGLLQITE